MISCEFSQIVDNLILSEVTPMSHYDLADARYTYILIISLICKDMSKFPVIFYACIRYAR